MSISKSTSKHVTSHASHAKKTKADNSAVHVPSPPSQEVSAPTHNIVAATLAAAVAPAVAAPPPLTPPADLPPAVGAPAPPAGWEPTPKKRKAAKGLRPKAVQSAAAAAVAKELGESTTYADDFGSRAPAAAPIAFVLTNAVKWRETWAAAKKFFVYASEQRGAWENEALAHMDRLKPAFDYVTSRDPTVAEKYAATSKYLRATNAIAARAATVRKAKAKGANAPAPAVAPVAPETPAVTAPPAK